MLSKSAGVSFGALCLFCLLLLVVPFSSIYGQVLYGSIVGLVQDPSGSAVPGAEVGLTNTGTGQTFSGVSDEAGRFTLPNLQPGTYDLKVTAKGFKPYVRERILVTANTVTRADMQLEVGAMTEQVTVQAAATELQTDKTDTHSTITASAIEQMPLPSYRNYQSLENLVPGATPTMFQNSATDTPGRALATHINGTNAQNNVTRIDGAASINVWLPHHVGYVMPEEMVEEVNIGTTSLDAEQGMAGGGAMTVVTKSGTNVLHGSLFEFHDNQHLKARNFFQAATANKPLSIFNNYGGTLGGPIIKNKLFWFFSYDATRQRQGAVGTYSVAPADIRTGNFSAYLPSSAGGPCTVSANCAIIYDPNTGNADGTGRTPFPGNIIPSERISAASQKIQSYVPVPNQPGAQSNFFASNVPLLDRDYADGKVNFNRNDKHMIWGRYGRMWATAGGRGVFGTAVGPSPGSDPGIGDTVTQNMSIGHTYTFAPNLLLDGVIGYQRHNQNVTGADYGKNFGQILGIPGLNGTDIRQSGFPNIAVSGYDNTGVPNWMPLFRLEENFTTSHNITWTKGAHELRFGFDALLLRMNHWQPELSDGGPRGYFDFEPGSTGLNSTGATAPNYLNAYAGFLLGMPYQVEKGLQYILMTPREWQFGWYARDRWQISRKLTLNLGLRYEFYPLMTRAGGKGIEQYNPATNIVYLGGRGNVPKDTGITVSHKLFSPRVGLAYRLTDSTVIRTGYGINYDPLPFSRPLRGFYPLTINANNIANSTWTMFQPLSAGIPDVVGPDISTGMVTLPGNASERSPYAGEIHRGYTQSWNFTVERKLPLDFVTSVAYVGTQTTHQLADYDINAGSPGSGTTGLPYYKLYGRSVPTNMWDGYLSAHYHSLQVAINKQFSHGLLIKGAYTWSKAIDMTDDDGWASVNWNWGPVFHRNRAPAGYDRTHVFQVGWVYDLPVGTGKAYVKNGVLAKVLGNWQINGLMSAYTGQPFTVTASSSSLNAPNNTQTADQVKTDVKRLAQPGPGYAWYDKSAFAAVTQQRFGSTGRNILRGPGMWNTNLSIFKNIPVTERVRFQFRAEFYNLPNSSHFGTSSGGNGFASTNVTSSNFMVVNSAFGERQIRFALRLSF
jgi:outer membrane receptor protein involved in Fe transport